MPATTQHRLSSETFRPEDYDVVDYVDNCPGDDSIDTEYISAMRAQLAHYFPNASERCRCSHCNKSIRYVAVAFHQSTQRYVAFGVHCAQRLTFPSLDELKIEMLRKRAAAHNASLAAWRKYSVALEANAALKHAVETIEAQPEVYGNGFVNDVISRAKKYGGFTENQARAIINSIGRTDAYRARAAEREAQEATIVRGLAPVGRQKVCGKVLSTKIVESTFGSSLKMLVELENHSKVWVTVPAAADVDKDANVEFTATFELSNTTPDPHFAFGKRPSNLKILNSQQPA